MQIDYDPVKNARNIEKHGVSFDCVVDFRFDTAIKQIDTRKDYGELRVNALGYLGDRLHVLTFVAIEGGVRVISFRKANRREQTSYAKAQRIR